MIKYVSTSELNSKYGVSNVTVAKWLLLASKGEANLKYDKVGKRIRLLNTPENWLVLDTLGQRATTKRQKIYSSKTSVDPEFYNYFSKDELTEIVRDLEYNKNINYKFTYKGEGADYWDQFYQENDENGTYQVPERTRQVLDLYLPILVQKMKNYDEVNIVDIGPGNGLPLINFIKKLQKQVNLKKYIGIDISSGLLDQSIENISAEVKGLEYEKLLLDIERDRIDTAFSYSYSQDKKVANIVFILGGTILNSYETSSILRNIRRSLSPDDIVLLNNNVSAPINNFNFSYIHSPEAIVQDTWIPQLLGIDIDKCELMNEFDSVKNQKVEYLILDKDYTIDFEHEDFKRSVTLQKKDKITLWIYSIGNIDECARLFTEADFQFLDSITLPDNSHFIIAVKSNG